MTLSPPLILSIVGGYFLLLMLIAWLTSRNATNNDFFIANKQSPWYVVAFGMIGASLSGVTFISVPGMVGADYLSAKGGDIANMRFSYMQIVFGYVFGYAFIALVLLPLYYRLKLTSIYTYLEQRFGTVSYKTGAAFFLLSRTIGAAFRLYLVAMVLQVFVFDAWGIPFWATTLGTIFLIWVYTFRGGLKTIVWTDTLQTTFMLLAVILTVYQLTHALGDSFSDVWGQLSEVNLNQVFFFENGWSDPNNFFKQFFAGIFITIVMTGLDQDMMQKNLSCRNIGDAQKNMFTFSLVLVVVNFIFLCLGALLALYAIPAGVTQFADKLYPTIALEHLSWEIGVVFILGLVAAAYSSADSALTSLTTSFCVDFLGLGNHPTEVTNSPSDKNNDDVWDEATTTPAAQQEKPSDKWIRYVVHVAFSLILFGVIITFWLINDRSVINSLFKFAGYTYGPLLGLYAFGLFTTKKVIDKAVPAVCIGAPILSYFIDLYSESLLWGYNFGFELLLVNGLLTFIGLWLLHLLQKGRLA